MTLYHQASKNIWKTWLLFFIFLLFFSIVGYALSIYTESYLLLYFALFYAFMASFIGFFYSDRIVLSMSNAKKVEKKDHPEIYNIVENLCIASGMPIPKIYIIEDASPNAFATGRNPKKGVVCVTSGLLNILNRSELEAVVAHELAHIKNYDILIATLVIVLASSLTFLSHIVLRTRIFSGSNNKNGSGLIQIGALILLIIVAPIVALIIRLAISRKREFLADASGALLTRYPEGLISALEKIHSYPNPMKKTNDYTRNLYISDPEKKKLSGFSKLFLTHPPIDERVKALKQMKNP